MQTSCQSLEFLLSAFANHELAVDSREQVVTHLANCAVCRQKVEDYREIKNRLSTLPTLVLPENFFAGFQQGVMDRITRQTPLQNQQLGIMAFLYVLYRRHRFILSVVSLILLLVVPKWLTYQPSAPAARPLPLAQMLETRDWTGLYYAMLDDRTRNALLQEPVPARLLHAALTELIHVQQVDRKIRLGMQQVLMKVKTRDGTVLSLGRSAEILGRISAIGYEPLQSARRNIWNPQHSLQILQQLDPQQTVTINTLLTKNPL